MTAYIIGPEEHFYRAQVGYTRGDTGKRKFGGEVHGYRLTDIATPIKQLPRITTAK